MTTTHVDGDAAILECIRRDAVPLQNGDAAGALARFVGDAHFVLLGEASHGTHEFYRERAAMTQRLIEERRIDAVAVEADWPDAARVDRYVRGLGDDHGAEHALRGFDRFPGWMWRNAEVARFVEWLRRYNERQATPPVGFFGLDLYSLFKSIDAVVQYLERHDPAAAQRARADYACFEHCGRDSQRYAYETAFGTSPSCERAVLTQLRELQRSREHASSHESFYAEQNARLVKNAEEYYRTMFRGRVSSWNLRDRHMAETLDELALHLGRQLGRPARIAVWAHNSHIGDARATEIGRAGEWNLGQLTREAHGHDVVLVGFTTSHGHVMAASEWDGQHAVKRVRPALHGSYEALFHDSGLPAFFLPLRDGPAAEALRDERLERAIGVIYLPESERRSHYFHASLPRQFDAVLHFDTTTAVTPLDTTEHTDGEAPETFPSGT